MKYINHYPNPTSSDIITMNPTITPKEDNLPFPLKTRIPHTIDNIQHQIFDYHEWASGTISSTTTYTIAPAANARAYGSSGSANYSENERWDDMKCKYDVHALFADWKLNLLWVKLIYMCIGVIRKMVNVSFYIISV